MQPLVEVLSINPPRKNSFLATAKVRITFGEPGQASVVEIDDVRILKNHRQELWIALPTFSVQDGRNYRYEKTVDVSRGLLRQIETAVLEAYETWDAARRAEVRP